MNPATTPAASELAVARLPDGRELEYFAAGPEDGMALVCHHGTPGSALGYLAWIDVAAERGLRVIGLSRAGYGRSSRRPGRSVADVARDTAALLDSLGIDRFVTAGKSGGGPHALACGALLGERCRAVASLAGIAPYDTADIDFFDGMGAENVDEFAAAEAGEEALAGFLQEQYRGLDSVTGVQIVDSLGGLVSPPDRAVLTEEYAEQQAQAIRWGLRDGYSGWIDDDLAFVKNWEFELHRTAVPVTIWQGGQDWMVPGSHGRWLQRHVPGSSLVLEPDHGHMSLVTTHLPSVLDRLAEFAAD